MAQLYDGMEEQSDIIAILAMKSAIEDAKRDEDGNAVFLLSIIYQFVSPVEYNKWRDQFRLIKRTCTEMNRPIFFSKNTTPADFNGVVKQYVLNSDELAAIDSILDRQEFYRKVYRHAK